MAKLKTVECSHGVHAGYCPKCRIESLEAERDALAAYAEAGKHIVHEWGRGEFGDVAAAVQLDQWARTQPALCLASLKAEWQAEAMGEALDALDYMDREVGSDRGALDATRDELRERLNNYRRAQKGVS